MSRTTSILATIFFGNCLLLAYLATQQAAPVSIGQQLEQTVNAPAQAAPAPTTTATAPATDVPATGATPPATAPAAGSSGVAPAADLPQIPPAKP